MNILNARIRWNLGWGNKPEIEILVDSIPHHAEMRYTVKANMWYAEKDGYVSYFHWVPPCNNGGMGGRCFDVMTVDGTVTIKGPWSSRAGCVNFLGLGPIVDVCITDDERGYTFSSGAVLLSVIREALRKFCPGVELRREEDFHDGVAAAILGNDITYIPTLKGMSPEESKEYIKKSATPREPLTEVEYAALRARIDAYDRAKAALYPKNFSCKPDEHLIVRYAGLAAPPTNDQRSAVEAYESSMLATAR